MNLEVWTVRRDDRRWNVESISVCMWREGVEEERGREEDEEERGERKRGGREGVEEETGREGVEEERGRPTGETEYSEAIIHPLGYGIIYDETKRPSK